MRAVVIAFEGVGGEKRCVVISEVPAVDVVDLAVQVVVDAVARDLPRIRPELAGQVGVGHIHPRVDDGDSCAGSHLGVPRLGRVDVGARSSGCRRSRRMAKVRNRVQLTCVVERPLIGEEFVRRHRGGIAKVVRLREGDGWVALVLSRGGANRKPVRKLDELHPKRRKAQSHARADPGVRALDLRALSTGTKADHELAGHVLGRGRRKRQVGLKPPGGTGPARAGGCRSSD